MTFTDDASLYSRLMKTSPAGLAEALADAGLGIFLTNDSQPLVEYNSVLRAWLGLADEEPNPRERALQELVHPDDIANIRRLADENLAAGKSYTIKHRMLRSDGRYFPCKTHIKPILDEEGALQNVIGVMRNQDELERSKARMDRAERLAGIGNWSVTLPDRVLSWSDGTYIVNGYEPGEVEPTLEWARSQYMGDDAARVGEIIEEAIDKREDFEYRARIKTKSGREKHIHVVGEVELGSSGEAVAYSGIVRDVTDEVLREAQIRQSQKIEAIGNMTGGAAHDFNNLLSVILGNLELIRDEVDRPDLLDHCDAAIAATMSGAALTRNMLSFARRARLNPKTLDINQAVRGLERWARRTLPSTIDLEVSLLGGLWKTELDQASLESALLNLILNARDAMPDGGRLTIETANIRIDEEYIETRHEDVEPGRYVMLAVSDTGHGIPKEEIERIFEPFYTTKDTGEGSGLGLSMVQGFVKQSSGAVRVYSETDQGTTFKLYFRARYIPSDTVQQTAPKPAQTGPRSAEILFAEDELEVQNTLATTLRRAGYHVHTTSSGDEAKEAFLSAPDRFDLLLSDIVMPGSLLGTRLAKELRAIRPDLPVIFLSGYANEATVHGNGLLPEDIRLMKPVRRANLLEAIKKTLERTK